MVKVSEKSNIKMFQKIERLRSIFAIAKKKVFKNTIYALIA
jgi:hypothetical protein